MLKMILHHKMLLVLIIFSISIVSSTTAHNYNSTGCEHSCGSGTELRHLHHPFGFSDGCEIRLNCSGNGEIRIGEFQVQNVTPDKIAINLPASCNRSIESIRPLFGKNYALAVQNGLLLHRCPTNLTSCVIPDRLIRNGFDLLHNCDKISCFSGDYKEGVEFLSYEDVNRTRCTHLYSSIAAESEKNSSVSLEFQTVLLNWWLEGPCQCSENETCSRVNLTGGGSGFRCSCKNGFTGEGNGDSFGCRREHVFARGGKTTKVGVLVGDS